MLGSDTGLLPGDEVEGDDKRFAEMNDRVYSVLVAWLEVGEDLRIAVFMVTCPSRQVLIVRPPEVRSGSRRVEHTCPSGWLVGCTVSDKASWWIFRLLKCD
jgi:hypothetical protein